MIRHYELLHLKPSATQEQIRQAYLDLARVWHPDRFANDERLRKVAGEKMMEITAAYRALASQALIDAPMETPPGAGAAHAAGAPPAPRRRHTAEEPPAGARLASACGRGRGGPRPDFVVRLVAYPNRPPGSSIGIGDRE